MGFLEKGIEVRENRVADLDCGFGGGGDRGPDIGFLWDGGEDIVVAVEGEKGGELHPTAAEFGVGVAVEATFHYIYQQ